MGVFAYYDPDTGAPIYHVIPSPQSEHPPSSFESETDSSMSTIQSDDLPGPLPQAGYFVMHHGRQQPASENIARVFPFDNIRRYILRYLVSRSGFGGDYIGPVKELLAPIDGRRRQALELGTRTGTWIQAMATEFPHVQFRTLDVVPMMPHVPYHNIIFEVYDFTKEIQLESESQDAVFLNFILLEIVRDYRTLLREVYRVLRPGGLIHIHDYNPGLWDSEEITLLARRTNPEGCRYFDYARRHLPTIGIDPDTCDKLPQWLAPGSDVWDNNQGGFKDIKSEMRPRPYFPHDGSPMVRYSKLPFRHLVSLYDVHITHTPMIMAAEFSRSATARHSDFTTSQEERGVFVLPEKNGGRKKRVRGALVAQFAANDPKAFADACELIHTHVDGVDLNCGCPQSWAYAEHVGSWLLRQPDRVRDLVRAAKDRLGWSYPVSIKVRVDADLQRTQQLMETAVHAGASYITVHGRTRHQASTLPVNLPAISFARGCVKGAVPVIANGDAWSATENEIIRRETGCEAVMSARGLLANPALFSGYDTTPMLAVQQFVKLGTDYGLVFAIFHRHLAYMLESRFPSRAERTLFSSLASHASFVDYLEARGVVCT